MLGGYMGKFLWVNLTEGTFHEEVPDESYLSDFIGGYGLGARLLYDRIPAKVDPLGPQNILGFVTGPLTGTVAPTGTRWTVVGKSPLTGGWGDANGSGFFAPALKRAGFDAVFFTGIAKKPVYLFVDEGRVELRDASALWGMDCYEIEDWVKANLGKDVEAACIGPSGEKQVLISGIVHYKGRIAARSGLGAVMGSKQLKMIAVRGTHPVPLASPEAVKAMNRKYVKEITSGVGFSQFYRVTGTPGYIAAGARNGDSPTKNWGASTDHFPDAGPFEFQNLLKHRLKKGNCWKCPIACWGTSQLEYGGEQVEAHQSEYETASAFGTMTMNNDYPSILKANEICNRYGLDTISAGSCIAFAIECYEKGLINKADTGGIELAWGDHQAMNQMLKKVALREDFGDILAMGVKRAAEYIGPEASPFAVHCGGQELAMHDPRHEPGLGAIYKIEATPGRHTQGCQYTLPPGYESGMPEYGTKREQQTGRGHFLREAISLNHVMSVSGVCLFGYLSTHVTFIPEFLSAVMGKEFTVKDMLEAGERISNIRQAFNVREGINPLTQPLPERAFGRPPLQDGPTAGLTVQVEAMVQEYLEDMGWTQDAAIPCEETLVRMGLADVAKDLWPRNQ